MVHNKIKNDGFTLLEMLIALSVISVGVMAAFTLSIANLNTAKANYQRVLAANLAREGVEVVRNIRDSNWLKIQSNFDCDEAAGTQLCTWDQNLDQGTSTVSYNIFDLGTLIATDNIQTCFADSTCVMKLWLDHGSYSYQHANGELTNMARLLILKAICRDSDGTVASPNTYGTAVSSDLFCDESINGYEDKIGLQATSQVFWRDFSKEHTIEVVEELYNWREYEN